MEDLGNHAIPIWQALAVLQTLFSCVLIPAAFALVRRLGTIRDHLAELNSRTSTIEQWEKDHDIRVESDDRQHLVTRQQCQQLHQQRLDIMNERLNELWMKIGDRRQGKRPTD